MTTELITCPMCEGEGEVHFNTSRSGRDPQCDDSARCPTCHGEGMIDEDTPIFDLEDAAEAAAEDAAEARAEMRAEDAHFDEGGWL